MKKIVIIIFAVSLVMSSCKKKLEEEFQIRIYSNTVIVWWYVFRNAIYLEIYIQDYGEWWWELAGTGSMGVAGYTQVSQRYITDRYAWFSEFDDLSGTMPSAAKDSYGTIALDLITLG